MKWLSKLKVAVASLAATVILAPAAFAQLANIKVVTDANPDYSDMESMVRSITSNWKTDAEKMYALFYWDHIARRQTQPMSIHGTDLTDPIRQFNDYGFTMCSTISGIKCGEWSYMGYPCRLFDISLHTVPDVWYDGAFHHYDNSLSTMYTMPDGKTIAGIEDIGRTMSGPETGGKPVAGYIAMYHCLDGTGPNGYLEGADTDRDLKHLGQYCFKPRVLKYRYYYYSYDLAHRYILNLRDGEVYTRYYSRQDADSPNALQFQIPNSQTPYKADPAYYTPNGLTDDGKPRDPESVNVRYHIRGNGLRTWTPLLDDAHLPGEVNSSNNIKSVDGALQPGAAGQDGEVVFKIEGANVITSLKIHADIPTASNGAAAIAISTTNGMQWKDVWKSVQANNKADLKLVDDVNGSYEVLVKITLSAKVNPQEAVLKTIRFDIITQINSKTQPSLRLGVNTVYVGDGDQSESIVYWPDLRNDRYKAYAVETQNVQSAWQGVVSKGELEGKSQDEQKEIRHKAALKARAAVRAHAGTATQSGDDDKIEEFNGYTGCLMPETSGQEGHVVFKIDAPADITRVTYGGRIELRDNKGHIDFLHSFDGGKTWTKDLTFDDAKAPWDKIRYVTLTDIPAGTRSVLMKYSLNCTTNETRSCSLYAVNMEADHKLAAPSTGPLEVTFNWRERQKDYSTLSRSYTQLVEKLPSTFKIDVGGFDQPIVDSLTVNLQGARGDVKYGYSDGKDVGGEKWVGNWVAYGKNLALGKPYTLSIPSASQWGSGDPKLTKLTDGVVGSSFTSGTTMGNGPMWSAHSTPEIVVDLGEPQKCAAFRIHTLGYPWWDAIKGEIKDKCEVLTSLDGKDYTSQGFFDFNLHWKDLPVNFMYPDDETLCAYNFMLPLAQPVEARYVKYVITAARSVEVSEVQVLDSYTITPFDLRIALPDAADNGKAPPPPDISPNARKWEPSELPTTIGKVLKPAPDDSDNVKMK